MSGGRLRVFSTALLSLRLVVDFWTKSTTETTRFLLPTFAHYK